MASSVIHAPQYGIHRKSALAEKRDDKPSAVLQNDKSRSARTQHAEPVDLPAARPRFEYPKDLVLPDTSARQMPADQPQRSVAVIVRKSRRIVP